MEQEHQQPTLAELKELRRQKILAKQQDRMALVTNTTVDRVEMPEEFQRHQEYQKQLEIAQQQYLQQYMQQRETITPDYGHSTVLVVLNVVVSVLAGVLCFRGCSLLLLRIPVRKYERLRDLAPEALLLPFWAAVFAATWSKHRRAKGAFSHGCREVLAHAKLSAVCVALMSLLCM